MKTYDDPNNRDPTLMQFEETFENLDFLNKKMVKKLNEKGLDSRFEVIPVRRQSRFGGGYEKKQKILNDESFISFTQTESELHSPGYMSPIKLMKKRKSKLDEGAVQSSLSLHKISNPTPARDSIEGTKSILGKLLKDCDLNRVLV